MAIILGIDPGSRTTGYGIIESLNHKHRYITSGCIRLDPLAPWAERLYQIFLGIATLSSEFHPTESAIEEVFFHQNPQSALKLGQARGAAIVALRQHQIAVAEYSTRQIKQSVVGYGAADKTQIQSMVKSLLNLSGFPQEDAADGLAVALCHANSGSGVGQLQAITGFRKGRMV